jgi:uncharacterized damage-inducible protein DinB
MLRRALLLVAAVAVPAFGQATPPGPTRSNMDYARTAWREVTSNLLHAATEAPEPIYDYRPTPDVRTFGQILDHIAASQNGYCRMALGERPVGGGAGTGATSKTEVVDALRLSNELCARAYSQTDDAAGLAAYGGTRDSRFHVLLTNVLHDGEHYGNIVTYLRLNGIVPPSSR